MNRVRKLFVSLLLVVLAGCSSSTGGGGEGCTPGAKDACLCLDGTDGVRTCGGHRTWGACDCDATAEPHLELVDLDLDSAGAADRLLDFGPVLAGERVERAFTVRNAGDAPLSFALPGLDGPFSAEAGAGEVTPGDTVTVRVSFAPGAAGTFAGTLRIDSNGGSATVRVTGEGFLPALACAPAALDLGAVEHGAIATAEVRCTNAAPGAWSPTAPRIVGDDASAFGAPEFPPSSLAAGETWTIPVTFSATRTGASFARLVLGDAADRELASIPLMATVVEKALEVIPGSLDFGFVTRGSTAERPLLLRNHAPSPLPITTLSLEDPRGAFSLPAVEVPFDLPAATGEGPGTLELPVRFTPPEDGSSYAGTLTIESAGSEARVSLAGFGGGPAISCSPVSLDFGTVASGLPAARTTVCTNVGTGVLQVAAVRSTSPEFVAVPREPLSPAGYGVGASFTIDVTYVPVDDGADAAAIEVVAEATNSSAEAPYRVEVAGVGRALPPCLLTVSPSPLAFGIVAPGTEATLELVLRNDRPDAECVVRDVRLAAACPDSMTLPGGSVPLAVVPAGGELRFPVRFAPAGVGAASCDLIFDPLAAATSRVVPISATAQVPCLVFAPGETDAGVVAPGCSSREFEVRMTNVCSAPLAIADIVSNRGLSDEFQLRSAPIGGPSLSPGESSTFAFAYQPTGSGADLAGFLVSLGGSPAPCLHPVRGRGATQPDVSDTFTVSARPKVDVLLVIDNGAGMGAVQAALATNLKPFLSFAQAQEIGYQIGVTTTGLVPSATPTCPGGAGGGENGRLFPPTGSTPRILGPNTPNLEASWGTNVTVGTCHTAGSALEAAFQAVHPPLADSADDPRPPLAGDGNLGFLRSDAHLAVIAITNQPDASAGTVAYYQTAFAAVKGLDRTRKFRFHAVTGEAGTGCTRAGTVTAGTGDRLISQATASGGVFRSICTASWEQTLRELSAAAFGIEECFPLTGQPDDLDRNGTIRDSEGELEVRQNGRITGSTGAQGQNIWTYRAAENAVCFFPLAVPLPGTQVEVRYRNACLPVQP